MKNKNLAIAIPTYNRAEILKENILLMLHDIRIYSIPIYISDDSTNDQTERIIDDLIKEYEYIYYTKNSMSLGHDQNCIRTLNLPSEEYVWYLGDSIIIKPLAIKKILDEINKTKYDFISVNGDNRDLAIKNKLYTDGRELMTDLCWHLTMTGATIYSQKAIKKSTNFEVEKFKNFPQTAVIFKNFAEGQNILCWINEKLIEGNKNKQSYWIQNVFEVFLYDWFNFINNLPEYYNKVKFETIRSHSKNTGLFSISNFIFFRLIGIYDLKTYNKYSKFLKKCCNINIPLVILISVTPKSFIKKIKKLLNAVKISKKTINESH